MRDQHGFDNTIGAAMAAIRLNDADATMRAIADLTELGEDALRTAAMRLAGVGADLITQLFPGQDDDSEVDHAPLVELRLTDLDGQTVAIDELEPTLRSAIRMVLALVNEVEQAAIDQLDLACASDDQTELASVVIQLLMWTTQMRGQIDDPDVPAPGPWPGL